MAVSSNSLDTSIRQTTDGFQKLSTAVNKIFGSYQKTLNSIMPSLNSKEQDEFSDAFDKYVEFLTNMQSFISNLEIGVRYADSIEHLREAVPVQQLETLIVDVRSIMKKFFILKALIERKVNEESKLPPFRDMMLGMIAVGVGVALIATGVGGLVGFGVGTKGVIMLGLAASFVGSAGAIYAHHAMNQSDIGKILKTLDKIQSCLSDIAREQAKIRGKHQGFVALGARSSEHEKRIFEHQQNELMDILKRTQNAVDQGFEILKRR